MCGIVWKWKGQSLRCSLLSDESAKHAIIAPCKGTASAFGNQSFWLLPKLICIIWSCHLETCGFAPTLLYADGLLRRPPAHPAGRSRAEEELPAEAQVHTGPLGTGRAPPRRAAGWLHGPPSRPPLHSASMTGISCPQPIGCFEWPGPSRFMEPVLLMEKQCPG